MKLFLNKLTKKELYGYLTAIYCTALIISNTIAGKTFLVGKSIQLPSAVIIFPVVYIINDILAEVYGYKKARNSIILGFTCNLIAVIAFSVALALPSPAFVNVGAFNAVLGNMPRMLVASFAAYIVGSLINSKLMVKMKEKYEKYLFARCIASTAVGETLDATIFISIGFFGVIPTSQLLVMITGQAIFKTVYEIVVYPLTKQIIKKAKAMQD